VPSAHTNSCNPSECNMFPCMANWNTGRVQLKATDINLSFGEGDRGVD